MEFGGIAAVVGNGRTLELALSALSYWDSSMEVFPTPRQAREALNATGFRSVSVVLVGLGSEPEEALDFIRSLRRESGMAHLPIAVWAEAGAGPPLLAEAYLAGSSSVVVLDGSEEDPARLAHMLHYWVSANQSPAGVAWVKGSRS